MGRQPLLQRLLGAAHRLPRLFSGTPEQLAELNRQLDRVEARRDSTNWIVNAPTTLEATRRYFANKGTPGCKAGLRFLVVTADGALQPCSMQFQRYTLEDRARMIARIHATITSATSATSPSARISIRDSRNCSGKT